MEFNTEKSGVFRHLNLPKGRESEEIIGIMEKNYELWSVQLDGIRLFVDDVGLWHGISIGLSPLYIGFDFWQIWHTAAHFYYVERTF